MRARRAAAVARVFFALKARVGPKLLRRVPMPLSWRRDENRPPAERPTDNKSKTENII